MENKMTTIKIEQGNCLEVLKEMPEQSVNTCVTSPPYWGLRDYGTAEWDGGDESCDHTSAKEKSRYDYKMQEGSRHSEIAKTTKGTDQARWKDQCPDCGAIKRDSQLGLEDTPEEYVENMVKLFREVRRVLRDDGTLWLNLGDSYARTPNSQISQGGLCASKNDHLKYEYQHKKDYGSVIKPKDLVGIPWMVAFALRADGWYLRQDIIWHKPNPMPESVKDRCTKAHEYIFLLSKNSKYYYDNDAIKEPAKDWGTRDRSKGKYHNKGTGLTPHTGLEKSYPTKNKRSVWTVTTKPFKGAHFAVFPMDLIEPCVLAGCPENGTVLDPFGGSGTTGLVAKQNKRNAVLIELNAKYIDIAEDRIASTFMQSCLDI